MINLKLVRPTYKYLSIMNTFLEYQLFIEEKIKENYIAYYPKELYDPIYYILTLKGKRIRPILCLLAEGLFQERTEKSIKPALALELFHNFTLVHDDIIDKSPLRKGKMSVHKKWSVNTAILSGDLLLSLSYQFFEGLPPLLFHKVLSEFSKMAIKVYQGQQIDINLEKELSENIEQYIQMAYHKTGSLIGCSLKIGAIMAKAPLDQSRKLYEIGKNIGIAFQMKNDLLDIFSKETPLYNDLYKKKKSIVYFKALEKASSKEKEELLYFYSSKFINKEKIDYIKEMFKNLYIEEEVEKEINFYKEKSFDILKSFKKESKEKNILEEFLIHSI